MRSEELWQVHLVSCLVVLERFPLPVISLANTGLCDCLFFFFFLLRLPFSCHNIWARLGQATWVVWRGGINRFFGFSTGVGFVPVSEYDGITYTFLYLGPKESQ